MAIPVGPVWLALKSGAPLLTVLCRRDRTGSAWFVAEVGPEIELLRGHELDLALEHGADQVAAFLARALHDHPGQWLFWDGFEPGGLLSPRPEEPLRRETP